MKKVTKDAKAKKLGKPYKEFLPPNIKNPPREGKPLQVAENFLREFEPFYKPNSLPEEWPDDETVKVTLNN